MCGRINKNSKEIFVKIQDIAELLKGNIIHKGDAYDSRNAAKIIASDLMSDVLVVDEEIDVLVTSLATYQALRTADIVCAGCVVIVNGKAIMNDMEEMAKELGITLIQTELSTFEVCVLLNKK